MHTYDHQTGISWLEWRDSQCWLALTYTAPEANQWQISFDAPMLVRVGQAWGFFS